MSNFKIAYIELTNTSTDENFDYLIIFFLLQLFLIGLGTLIYNEFFKCKDAHEKLEMAFEEIENKSNLIESQKENLVDLNSMKDKFFSIICHDLRNPFNLLLNYTFLLEKSIKELDDIDIIEYTQKIKESVYNLDKLLDNLLKWARIQQGKIVVNIEENDLYEVAINNYYLLKPIAEQKKITLNQNINEFTAGYFDYNMIDTVIRNLISNAIKFTFPGGTINISAIEKNTLLTVCIEDNGIGMDPSKANNLFRIDYCSSNTFGTANEPGTGLGLIFCKEFIEKHNGKIWVESELDKGTKFYFSIPKYKNNSN